MLVVMVTRSTSTPWLSSVSPLALYSSLYMLLLVSIIAACRVQVVPPTVVCIGACSLVGAGTVRKASYLKTKLGVTPSCYCGQNVYFNSPPSFYCQKDLCCIRKRSLRSRVWCPCLYHGGKTALHVAAQKTLSFTAENGFGREMVRAVGEINEAKLRCTYGLNGRFTWVVAVVSYLHSACGYCKHKHQ